MLGYEVLRALRRLPIRVGPVLIVLVGPGIERIVWADGREFDVNFSDEWAQFQVPFQIESEIEIIPISIYDVSESREIDPVGHLNLLWICPTGLERFDPLGRTVKAYHLILERYLPHRLISDCPQRKEKQSSAHSADDGHCAQWCIMYAMNRISGDNFTHKWNSLTPNQLYAWIVEWSRENLESIGENFGLEP